MRRKKAALAIGVVAVLAFALPALASATWTHKGKGELKENASITLSGELTLSTSAGNVTCPTELGATLTESSSSGHVNSFVVAEPSKCDLSGSLGAICGTHGLTKVEKTGTWALTADETDITISSIDVHYVLAGCLIPSFSLKGSATAGLDKTTAIGKATLSGPQTLYNALEEESGVGELKGTLSVSPAGTYGVKTAPLVETKWTDSNKHLSKDGELTLNGTFSFSGSGGSVSCPASVKLNLESSTVEEEESEGQFESFAVAKPSECDVGGTLGTLCGTHSVSGVEQTGIGSLTTNEEDISMSGLALDYKFTGCAVTSLRVEGNPTVSVNSPGKIGSATFSAGALQIYNSGGEKTGSAEAGGSVSASPGGTYQLAATDTEWTGSIATTAGPGFAFRAGPCQVHVEADLSNELESSTGEVTDFTFTTPCETNIPGCTVQEASPSTAFPWQIEVEKSDGLRITGVGFKSSYNDGCTALGITPSVPLGSTGTLTGTFNTETRCMVFSESGDMSGALGIVRLDGQICN